MAKNDVELKGGGSLMLILYVPQGADSKPKEPIK
jgi:hypothetical protein